MAAPTPLGARVMALADELERHDAAAFRQAAAQARLTLGGALRVAVVGDVKAGKSTLVNALLGRRVAPTSEAECTRIVTHYRFAEHPPERGEVVLRDGTTAPFHLTPAGALPESLPWPTSDVSHAIVHLHESALRTYTLIDTPGLATTTAENAVAARAAVLGLGGSRQADALIYVFRDGLLADNVAFLREFAQVAGKDGPPGRASAIGVLSHADTIGDVWRDDPLAVARSLATELAAARSEELGTVIPVAGKLAETGRTGRFSEELARGLARLADADPAELRWAADPDDPVRRQIWDRIGPYGLLHARTIATGGLRSVLTWLEDRSGIEELLTTVRQRYGGRNRVLKAARAVRGLRAAARATGRPARFDPVFSEADLHPDMHLLRALAAWERISARNPSHPALAELGVLLGDGPAAVRLGLAPGARTDEISARAHELQAVARRRAALASDSESEAAYDTIARSYAILGVRDH